MTNRVVDVNSKTVSHAESMVQISVMLDSETHRHLLNCYDSVSGTWSLSALAVLMRAAAMNADAEQIQVKSTRSTDRSVCYYCYPNRCMCPSQGYGKVEAR